MDIQETLSKACQVLFCTNFAAEGSNCNYHKHDRDRLLPAEVIAVKMDRDRKIYDRVLQEDLELEASLRLFQNLVIAENGNSN